MKFLEIIVTEKFVWQIHRQMKTKGNKTPSSDFVRSVCYPCLCLLALVGTCFHQMNTVNQHLSGFGMFEKWYCNWLDVAFGLCLLAQFELAFKRWFVLDDIWVFFIFLGTFRVLFKLYIMFSDHTWFILYMYVYDLH